VVDLAGGRKDLVIAVPFEVWGLDPDTGKLRWHAKAELDGNVCPSAVAEDGIVYAFGGFRRPGSLAVRAGGKGDVTDTHVLWSSRISTYVPTPIVYQGYLYWVDDRGAARCVEAKTGKSIYRERLPRVPGADSRSRGFYASVVLANGKLYAVSRTGGTYVLAAKPKFEQIAVNRFQSDSSDFNATPAISNGRMFLRSNRFLYCVGTD